MFQRPTGSQSYGSASEMTRHQQTLVDTSFEEGQYESGILLLEQLRSAKLYPAPSHIRQILYMSLHTSIPDQDQLVAIPGSPSKAASRHQRLKQYPSHKATFAAQTLLQSYSHTIKPNVILDALHISNSQAFDDEDSFVAKQARYIAEAKNCWSIIREDFLRDKCASSLTSADLNSQREKPDEEGFHEDVIPAVVASNAWPILACFVRLFERDEMQMQVSGSDQHSPLLLAQVPAPRAGGTKWDVDDLLDVIFFCLKQELEDRKVLGARLTTMLMNLVSARLLDVSMVIMSIYKRISTFSELELSAFLASFELTPSTLLLKVTLVQKYLMNTTSTHGSSGPRPKPQARAQPRPVRRDGSQNVVDSMSESMLSIPAVGKKSLLPSAEQVVQALEVKSTQVNSKLSSSFVSLLKFELLIAYGMVQTGSAGEERDPTWLNLLREGRVLRATATLTDDEPGEPYRTLLPAMIRQWTCASTQI